MSILKRLQARDSSSLSAPSEWLSSMFYQSSKSGVNVTTKNAREHTSVYACVNILSETLSTIPLFLYKKETKNNKSTKLKALHHPLYQILLDEPNEEMTSVDYWQLVMLELLLQGNHYSQIVRNNAGEITAIYPLVNKNMQIVRLENGKLAYIYMHSSFGQVPLDAEEVLHFKGMTLEGIVGLSPISQNRHTIGASIAMETFGATLFKNGATPSGVVSGKGVTSMSDTAFTRFKESFKESYTGLMNAGKPLILEDGFDFKPITISNKDGQYIESRKFTKAEIASIFRVPLHMINELDKATFSNIEHQSIKFVTDAVYPWAVRIEKELKRKLLTKDEKKSHYMKFSLAALLRGDTSSRYTAYESAITKGCWMSRNEARELEDLNPIKGLDEMIVPLNFGKEGDENATD